MSIATPSAPAVAPKPMKLAGTMTLRVERAAPELVVPLFQPWRLTGALELANRIVQAPCTRNCAEPGLVPTSGAADYYAARVAAGLLITEATLINADCQGYRDTPGIYSEPQVRGWARVTDRVHEAGGIIFSQIWHLGRLAHTYYTGVVPKAPSMVPAQGPLHQVRGVQLVHRPLMAYTTVEIRDLVLQYVHAARNAIRAGFDGVELHGANGYLIDQFLRQHTNKRFDGYGGGPRQRARFALDVVDAVAEAIGPQRMGLRVSPAAHFGQMEYVRGDEEGYIHLLEQLGLRKLAYVHVAIIDDGTEFDELGGQASAFVRRHYPGTVIGNGGYSPRAAAAAVSGGRLDLIAFGRLFIANPDLVQLLRDGAELRAYERQLLESFR